MYLYYSIVNFLFKLGQPDKTTILFYYYIKRLEYKTWTYLIRIKAELRFNGNKIIASFIAI